MPVTQAGIQPRDLLPGSSTLAIPAASMVHAMALVAGSFVNDRLSVAASCQFRPMAETKKPGPVLQPQILRVQLPRSGATCTILLFFCPRARGIA